MARKKTTKVSYYENKIGTRVHFFKDEAERIFARIIYKDGKIKEVFINNKAAYSSRLKEQGYLKKVELINN